ncbi:MAG TPA: hypothetical protein VN048_07585 [Verrucomicrobiae bacterium]|nr:hypothetical protein [Verrucomicrobiae bacterium]
MKDILSAAVLMMAAFMLWGVGNFTLRKCGGRSASWPVCIGVGLAVFIFAGGILNCVHIARGPVLWALAGAAAIISILEAKRIKFERIQGTAARFELIMTGLVIAGVTGFAIHTQLPPKVFNCDDDFQRYFPHPVSMLATGTVLGSPLGGLGSTTLGGQAFLHGFVLSVLPINYINGVDAVFGLMVLMLITAAAGWRRYSSFPGAVLGPVMVAMINPEYVNVSSLYLGSVLMATAVMLVVDEKEESGPPSLILGLVYASLVALKSTFVFFPLLHLPVAALMLESRSRPWKESRGRPWKEVFGWAAMVAIWAGVGLTPWIATHFPNYMARGMTGYDDVPTAAEGNLDLFSLDELDYRDCFLSYTVVAGGAFLVAVGASISWFSERNWRKRRMAVAVLAAGLTCTLSYLLFLCVLGPAWFGYITSLRYCIPTLLGCGVPGVVLFPRLSLRLRPEALARVPIIFCALIVAIFAGSTVARYRQALRTRSVLAFHKLADTDKYLDYCKFSLSGETSQRIHELQAKVPSGDPILAILSTPFLLDFRRNHIIDEEPCGLLTPWAHVPDNIRYVIWQYSAFKNFGQLSVLTEAEYSTMINGPGVQDRTIGVRDLGFRKHLQELLPASKTIYKDDEFVVFQLQGPYK